MPPAGQRPDRPGPRPIALHLTAAAMACHGAALGLPILRSRPELWHPELRAEAARLASDLAGVPPEAIAGAVAAEADRRFRGFLAAVEAYRRHPARRRLEAPPAVWRQGTTRLLDFGAGRKRPGAPVLVVPSLINRWYVLDLSAERSFLRMLRRRGLRPLVVDWDAPGPEERGFGLDRYIAGRLEAALDAAVALAGAPVGLIGYCMGGLLALALALRRPDAVAALALLATPWDFAAGQPEQARVAAAALPLLEPLLAAGEAPVDLLQALFFALDPFQVVEKYRRFARLDPDSPRAAGFVLLEDWLNDGVPLAAPLFRECLAGWYGENRPGRRRWRVAGGLADPAALRCPALVVLPGRDRIVPPPSAAALADALPRADRLTPAAGHIGMVAGETAPAAVAAPVGDWLRTWLRTWLRPGRRPRLQGRREAL